MTLWWRFLSARATRLEYRQQFQFTIQKGRTPWILEGNRRTGALIISYMLAREGRPPFVLTQDDARGFLNPSSVIKNSRRQGLIGSFKLRPQTQSFVEFLEAQQNARFLSF